MAKKSSKNKSKARAKPKPAVIAAESFPHFRRYKKSDHPVLVVNERTAEEYNFRKVMHTPYDGVKKNGSKRNNEKVYPNPNPKDPSPMYIAKRVKYDKKLFFSSKMYDWKYKNEDKKNK